MTGVTPVHSSDPFTATAPGERHCAYGALAAAGPVHRITLPSGAPIWLIVGHDEVRAALTDPRLVKAPPGQPRPGGAGVSADLYSAMNSDLLHLDPPDHTRLRQLVSAAFTRRRIEQLAPRIQQIADELLDGIGDDAEVDLIEAFAYPLPITVICELLGVPSDGRAEFRGWSTTIVAGSLSTPQAWIAAATAMIDYVRELLSTKRRNPADDLLSALVAVRDGTDRLSEDELTSMVFLLLIAGHETTVNLIGNGVHALLTHPGQLALLRAEPDVLDVTRAQSPHLAFGHGIHHCLGAPLARLEGRIALGSLLARFLDLRLAVPPGELTWRPGVLMHGLTTLQVALQRPDDAG